MIATGNSLWATQAPDTLESLVAQSTRFHWPTSAELAAYTAKQADMLAVAALKPVKGRVAVLPMYGIVEQRASAWSYWFGGVSTELVGRAIDALVATREVDHIVLDLDSPGGTSYGCGELSDLIFGYRNQKPITAVANSLAASAMYWIGSSATNFYATPGGDVGSVGVYSMHVDYSAMLKAEGIEVTFVKAGKFKVDGNPYEPLSDTARDDMQQQVDDCYTAFVKAVARNRGVSTSVVRGEKFGQGRVVSAHRAAAVGMIDRVMTLRDVMGKLTGSKSAGREASAEMLRLRQAWRKMRMRGVG